MSDDQIVFSGHGVPMRLPEYITPGTRDVLHWEITDDLDEPIDMTGTAWTVTMHDAITGELIFTYARVVVDDAGVALADNELRWIATDDQTALLDYRAAYELRVVRDLPGPDMLAAGPVIFVDTTVPASEAAA